MKIWQEVFKQESIERLDLTPENLCSYGIKPLDDALKFIMPNDLVVLGADSGAGKSDLALQIASYNALKDKKVAVFFLEGGETEAMSRIKWKDICDIYYRQYAELGLPMDYSLWRCNMIKHPILNQIESELWLSYQEKYKTNLQFCSITKDFGLENFLIELLEYHKLSKAINNPFDPNAGFDVDLIVIDHLQYFSLVESETEISQITKILREVKNITDRYKIPVILVSHLRKKTKDRGIPDQEDFYGSSNIPKIATTAIVLCPALQKYDYNDYLYPTYMRIVKSRIGIKPFYAIKVNYDIIKKRYEENYDLYYINDKGFESSEKIPYEKLPFWAKGKDESTSTHITDSQKSNEEIKKEN